jgi:aminomethyltransferase
VISISCLMLCKKSYIRNYFTKNPSNNTPMSNSSLLTTPLTTLHQQFGAKLVPFAGYQMPLHYPSGALAEHRHTRAAASLFDVSHMGQIRLSGEHIAAALEALMPANVIDLPVGRQCYALLTNDRGGIIDDVIVSRYKDSLQLVVNAACKHNDKDYLRAHLSNNIDVRLIDRALLALQGPQARAVMKRLVPLSSHLTFMSAAPMLVAGFDCLVACCGYTGEDGFEIAVDAAHATALAKKLLAEPEVAIAGLAARDSLRLEAGLCLYGQDIDDTTTPIEADLGWAIAQVRKPGGERAGGYPGATVIERQLADRVTRRRCLLRPTGRSLVRAGTALVDAHGESVGTVTSGGFGVTAGHPIAMGYIVTDRPIAELFALVRGKRIPLQKVDRRFVSTRYYT